MWVSGEYGSTSTGPGPFVAQQSNSISIGKRWDMYAEDIFHGQMSCLQFFDKALTKEEVMKHQYRCQEDARVPGKPGLEKVLVDECHSTKKMFILKCMHLNYLYNTATMT